MFEMSPNNDTTDQLQFYENFGRIAEREPVTDYSAMCFV